MKNHQIMVRIDESLLAFVNIEAEKNRMSRSEWVRQELWKIHDKSKGKKKK